MGNNIKYWKSLDELKDTPEFTEKKEHEFAEQLPADLFGQESTADLTSTNRRDFLKFLGFGIGAAALASCEAPVMKTIPYVVNPEEITPGVANWYSSTYADGYDYCSVIVKTREGRPIKVEGNKRSKITQGGVNARVQGSVLSLYDSNRLKSPKQVNGGALTDVSWDALDNAVTDALKKAGSAGKTIAIVSSTILSPTTHSLIRSYARKFPTTRHVMYDAVSSYAMAKAHEMTHGSKNIPSYDFSKAKVIVSFGADFLANWISPVEFSKQYSRNRKVSKENKEMSRHVHFETTLSVTGSNADYRFPLKPSQMGNAIVQLYNALTGGGLSVGNAKADEAAIKKTAEWLNANKGKALVVCGLNDVNAQVMVNEINKHLGSYGTTINTEISSYYRQGDDEKLSALVEEMNAGKVGVVILYNCNPVYNTGNGLGFAAALAKADFRVSLSGLADATAKSCNYVAPDHHYLESWNDAKPKDLHFSLGQPAISPLFRTRQAQESLMKWSGIEGTYLAYLKKYWMYVVFPCQSKYGADFTRFWNDSLHDGVAYTEVKKAGGEEDVPAETETSVTAVSGGDTTTVNMNAPVMPAPVSEEVKKEDKKEDKKDAPAPSGADLGAAAAALAAVKGGDFEVVLYEKTAIGDGGSTSGNPWLLEFPDPVSKVTWANYVTMNPLDMEGKYSTLERQDMKGDLVSVSFAGVNLTGIPVFPQPGQARGTIGIALGYGKDDAVIHKHVDGKNAYPMVQMVNGTVQYTGAGATVSESTGSYHYACTQQQHTMMGRKIVNETDLQTYAGQPKESWNAPTVIPVITKDGGHEKKSPDEVTLWQEHHRPGSFWSMAIDLNACTGCGSCVISCHAENNIPVVGKDQVSNARDLHWMRIDRYFSSPMSKPKAKEEGLGKIDMYLQMEYPHMENPKVVFQPMMCQHCDNAPCETVCPVLATSHSMEGLNMMTYNRCVGTRYCANNCPYKVRRFNWYNYTGLERFREINPTFGENGGNELGRMVLNPDVVVRTRGVMEKCSMCVQRIQEGKLNAKANGRPVIDGEIQTACSQSCPTDAITFGDLNNPESAVAKLHADERTYKVLDDVGVQPTVFYLTKVRNDEGEVKI
ncbi:MAG: TAT-variant-translocated molybdopterin oxidoreductase [Bacteroidia bacterium]|nr:TAT-variant-translocated molybdopterin oxidoreductase [Bacteroidia bacterium]